jgi:hypothetical protein
LYNNGFVVQLLHFFNYVENDLILKDIFWKMILASHDYPSWFVL